MSAQVGSPWFTASALSALRDFWAVYRSLRGEFVAEMTALAERRPELKPLIEQLQAELKADPNTDAAVMLQSISAGQWQSFAQTLRTHGEACAIRGVEFGIWNEFGQAYLQFCVPHLVKAYGSEPERLSAAIIAMANLIQQSMTTIAGAYLETKERLLTEQRQIAEWRAAELSASTISLQRQTSILSSILDSMVEGVVVCDAQGDITLFNRAAERITKLSGSAQPRTVWSEVYASARLDSGEPLARREPFLARAIRGEHIHNSEFLVTGATAPLGLRLSINAVPLIDDLGVIKGGVATLRDITEETRLAEARQRAMELELENQRIQEANRLKSEFLANMSHELRTPLNSIIGFTELLYRGLVPPDAPEHVEFLGDILTSGRHLLQLINDILDLSKVEAGRLDFSPEVVSLQSLITEVIGILRTAASAKHILIDSQVDPTVTEVIIDPNRLKQILYNYLSNALKFTPDGGSVTVRALPDGAAFFRIEVEDTGIGISENNLARLFVDFQQLDPTITKRYGGTGLGLALTRRLVEAQGGTTGVRSRQGHGSIFSARLLRVSEPQRKDGPPESQWPAQRQ